MYHKNFIFTIDDNIRFLKELTEINAPSLFSHPYTAMLKELHDTYGVKVHMNLFYLCPSFTLSQMTDRYRCEWEDNADWLKLSFHSRMENEFPYRESDYGEVFRDCCDTEKEILRFAGKNSLAKTTTIHYCQTKPDGIRALKDCGIRGLLGLYGTKKQPQTSYDSSEDDCRRIRGGNTVLSDGMSFAGIDIILNCFDIPQIREQLLRLNERDTVKLMIHEQYFYKDYAAYQPDFRQKLEFAFSYLTKSGFIGCFFEDLLPAL